MKGHVFLRYHKPTNVLSTTLPTPHGRSIMDALSQAQRDRLHSITGGRFVVPIGRLDKDSTGLLLLTTNESITGALLRPGPNGSPLRKVYDVQTRKRVQTAFIERLQKGGVELLIRNWGREKKVATSLPCDIERLSERVLRFTLREGKNRQIRKMLGSGGHAVSKLHRVAFGPVELGALAVNDFDVVPDDVVASMLALAAAD